MPISVGCFHTHYTHAPIPRKHRNARSAIFSPRLMARYGTSPSFPAGNATTPPRLPRILTFHLMLSCHGRGRRAAARNAIAIIINRMPRCHLRSISSHYRRAFTARHRLKRRKMSKDTTHEYQIREGNVAARAQHSRFLYTFNIRARHNKPRLKMMPCYFVGMPHAHRLQSVNILLEG